MQQGRQAKVRGWYMLVLITLLCSGMFQPLSQYANASAAGPNANSIPWTHSISDWQLDEEAGLLYVLSSANDNLYFIDTEEMKIQKSLTVGSKPNAMNRYEDILYIALSGVEKIARVDLSTQSLLTPISTVEKSYYVATTSTHLLYSTDSGTFKYQFSDQTNAYMNRKSRASLYTDESTNRVYIGEPFWSRSNFTMLNYLTNEVISESRSHEGNLIYPNEKIYADENYIYFAGSKIDKNNLTRVYGTYPAIMGSFYQSAQIYGVTDRFVLTHQAIFEKDTLKKVADLPYQTTRALISNNGDTIYLFDKDNFVIEKFYLIETTPETLTLMATESQYFQANHKITDITTNEATPYLFVISEETNDLVVMDKRTNRVVNTVTIGSKPSDIKLLNDIIYIAFSGENNIGRISISEALSPNGIFARIPTIEYPYRIAPDVGQLFYTAESTRSFSALIEASGTEKTYGSLNYPDLFVDEDKQTLYVADSRSTDSRIYSFSIESNELSLKASTPMTFKYVEKRYVHADGEYVYYGHDRLKASDLTVVSSYPEQIIYAKDQLVFGTRAVYDRETSEAQVKLPFIAFHVYVSEGGPIYISSEQRLYYLDRKSVV